MCKHIVNKTIYASYMVLSMLVNSLIYGRITRRIIVKYSQLLYQQTLQKIQHSMLDISAGTVRMHSGGVSFAFRQCF